MWPWTLVGIASASHFHFSRQITRTGNACIEIIPTQLAIAIKPHSYIGFKARPLQEPGFPKINLGSVVLSAMHDPVVKVIMENLSRGLNLQRNHWIWGIQICPLCQEQKLAERLQLGQLPASLWVLAPGPSRYIYRSI